MLLVQFGLDKVLMLALGVIQMLLDSLFQLDEDIGTELVTVSFKRCLSLVKDRTSGIKFEDWFSSCSGSLRLSSDFIEFGNDVLLCHFT